MTGVVVTVLIFFLVAGGLGAAAYFKYMKKIRRAKAIERGLKMVPILIHLPPPSSDTQSGTRDVREVMREKTAQAEVLYNLLAGTSTEGFKSSFYGQRHIALELIVVDGLVHFFAAVPVALVGVVKQAVTTAYPGARLEEVEDHNIFNQEGRLAATLGGEMVLRADTAYPIATYEQLERDPMEAILTAVSSLQKQDGVAIQIMLRPAGQGWVKNSVALADSIRKGKGDALKFSAMDLAKAALKAPAERREEERAKLGGAPDVSQLQLSQVERIEEKTKHPGFEVLVRVIVSTGSVMRSQQLLREISTAFALYENPGLNGFKFLPAVDVQGLVTAFIFRFFPNELKSNVLSSAELATLFHLPDAQFTPSNSVARQQSKQVDGPVQLPTMGLLFGYNEFRDARKEIRLSPEDRRRHTYILGQTGTGKSTMLENLAVQDMLSGNGFAFIDPHGDSAEKLLALVPKERAEDVIYFNPADTQYPLGLNLFEFSDPAQKDFLVQETINMLYKLYDPGHTGIIGPRYEHWYRNAALTLMADPNGSTFIEIPKVFTDTEYLKNKFKYLKDPTVIDFWTKEMGQTSDYHKSEMLGWFVSKFGAFQNNEIMRNIIGQTKSSFNIREVMDKKKILIVNLSKGKIGELNSQLLGMIFVIKFQAAAMSRADIPEEQRSDFALYVDEFQNFSTDSFASILSEARKYRLNLIVANQFIGQLSTEIRDAVFGNIGTIVAHRMGPDDAEFMVKQFAPVFDAGDLVNLPNYHAAMRLMIGGLPSQPFTIADSAPLGAPNAELGVAIKQLSAAKYGHDKTAVEADLAQRLTGKAPMTAAAPAVPVSAAPAAVAPVPAAAPTAVVPAAVAAAPVAVPTPAVVPAQAAPAMVIGPIPAQAFNTVDSPQVIAPIPAAAFPKPMNGTGSAGLPTAAPAASVVPALPAANLIMPEVKPVAAPVVQPAGQPNASAIAALALAAAPAGSTAPVSAAAGAALDMAQLATTPPPIGAPPLDLDAPAAAAAPEPASAVSAAPAAPVPVAQTELSELEAAIEASAAALADPSAQPAPAAPVQEAVQAEAAADTAAPAGAPALAHTPPPIGAPPVDIDSPAPAPNMLSLDDITGKKKKAIIEEDPYASIDVLGPSAPKAVPAPTEVEEINEGVTEPAAEADWSDAPQPRLAEVDTADEPAAIIDESVTEPAPAAEPETDSNAEDSLMDGLPEGVHILEQPIEIEDVKQPAAPAAEPAAAPTIEAEATVEPDMIPAAEPDAPVAAEPVLTADLPTPELAPAAIADTVAPAMTAEPAATEPALAEIVPTEPTAPVSPIEKAEHEIDDLLSVSLIHPDRRAPRLDMPANDEPAEPKASAPRPASPGMRVIQPLKPLDIATETSKPAEPTIADLQHPMPMNESPAAPVSAPAEMPEVQIEAPQEAAQEIQAAAPQIPPAPLPEVQPIPAMEAVAEAPAAVEEAVMDAPQPEPVPALTPADVPIVPAAAAPLPEIEMVEMPTAESLVAKTEPAPEAPAVMPAEVPANLTVEAPAEAQPEVQVQEEINADNQPQEQPAPLEVPAEAVKPADTTLPIIAPQLPGSAVLPQAPAERQKMLEMAAISTPAAKKDAKSLAPGEVYVDENGNVVIGGS